MSATWRIRSIFSLFLVTEKRNEDQAMIHLKEGEGVVEPHLLGQG